MRTSCRFTLLGHWTEKKTCLGGTLTPRKTAMDNVFETYFKRQSGGKYEGSTKATRQMRMLNPLGLEEPWSCLFSWIHLIARLTGLVFPFIKQWSLESRSSYGVVCVDIFVFYLPLLLMKQQPNSSSERRSRPTAM